MPVFDLIRFRPARPEMHLGQDAGRREPRLSQTSYGRGSPRSRGAAALRRHIGIWHPPDITASRCRVASRQQNEMKPADRAQIRRRRNPTRWDRACKSSIANLAAAPRPMRVPARKQRDGGFETFFRSGSWRPNRTRDISPEVTIDVGSTSSARWAPSEW